MISKLFFSSVVTDVTTDHDSRMFFGIGQLSPETWGYSSAVAPSALKGVLKSKTVKSEIFLSVQKLVLTDKYVRQASNFGHYHFFVQWSLK